MDINQIKELIGTFDESGLSSVKITQGEFSMEMEKASGLVTAPVQQVTAPIAIQANAPVAEVASVTEISGETIDSPMVGTFYGAPSPDSPAFVKVGDSVKKGQVVAILEAMKIMNELEAEFDCKILEILVKDGQAVEYDMPLYVVEKI